VNVLWVCLLVIVVGSMAGEWFGVQQRLGMVANFRFGHQGYEYVDLVRFWQILLFVGLLLWASLMIRAMLPAIRKLGENRSLPVLFLISCVAIALFCGAGLLWGRQTNLAIAEYWRWWVVNLEWHTGVLSFAFWSINIGLTLMVLMSVLPVGLMQTWASVEHGMWYARSAEFLQSPLIGTLRWMRVIGDSIFAVGIIASGWFVLGLVTGWSVESSDEPSNRGVPISA